MTYEDIIERFDLHPVSGFLPSRGADEPMPEAWRDWETLATALPTRLAEGDRSWREEMVAGPEKWIEGLNPAQQKRGMLLLSFLSHAFLHQAGPRPTVLPAPLAIPWTQVARQLGRLPVITHASMVLENWRLIDPEGEMEPENLQCLIQFVPDRQHDWFFCLTSMVEYVGGPAVGEMIRLREEGPKLSSENLKHMLGLFEEKLQAMTAMLLRMGEHLEPDFFYHQLRPYIASIENVTYEGVIPAIHSYHGGSAAQSSLIQAFDRVLGVKHLHPHASAYLDEMLTYMPAPHQAFLAWLESGPDYARFWQRTGLKEPWKQARNALLDFRTAHLKVVSTFIMGPARQSGETALGTGGTDVMGFLKEVRNDTA